MQEIDNIVSYNERYTRNKKSLNCNESKLKMYHMTYCHSDKKMYKTEYLKDLSLPPFIMYYNFNKRDLALTKPSLKKSMGHSTQSMTKKITKIQNKTNRKSSVHAVRNILRYQAYELCLTSSIEEVNLIKKRYKTLDDSETMDKYLNKEIDDKVVDFIRLEKIWEDKMYDWPASDRFVKSISDQEVVPSCRDTKKKMDRLYPNRENKFDELMLSKVFIGKLSSSFFFYDMSKLYSMLFLLSKSLLKWIFVIQIQNYVFRRSQLAAEQSAVSVKDNFYISEISNFVKDYMNSSYLIKSNYDGDMYCTKKGQFFEVVRKFNEAYMNKFLKFRISEEKLYSSSISGIFQDNDTIIGQRE